MYGAPTEKRFRVEGTPVTRQGTSRSHAVRFLLPTPTSAGHALAILMLGFAVEGATEAYQFLQRGSLGQGWFEYYTTLATTILGFYFIFLGLREWAAFHSKRKRRFSIPWPLLQLFANASVSIGLWLGRHSKRIRQKYFLPWALGMIGATVGVVVATIMIDRPKAPRAKRPIPWVALWLLLGGTASTAALSLVLGGGALGPTPFWIAWPVGGILVLAIGNFFFGLGKMVRPFGSPAGNALGWVSFAWSLGVGTVSGLVIGDRALQLLVELFTSWAALIASLAPFVVAISPLFVAYALMAGAFWEARHQLAQETVHYVARA